LGPGGRWRRRSTARRSRAPIAQLEGAPIVMAEEYTARAPSVRADVDSPEIGRTRPAPV
jgi:hypothetical protein